MMEALNRITVLKFGSSVLRSEDDLPTVVHEIYRVWRGGSQVVAVVSAFGDTTDQLLRSAESICPQPEHSALATLLATGEVTASALLGLALQKAGIPSKVLDSVQAGLRTSGSGIDTELVTVDVPRLRTELQKAVVVLPGFTGRNDHGETTLLGRGGSDFTALFLAHQLGARCVLVKDVNGLYTSDPARSISRPLRYAQATYETACRVGGQVVQPKAVRFAASRNLPFSITSIGAAVETEVSNVNDRLASLQADTPPLRVALLGCGTVGGGVYERLASLPQFFTVTGVATRDKCRTSTSLVPEHLTTQDADGLIEEPCDVVVELIGGTERAHALISSALRLGRNVVTANKALIAAEGEGLEALANENAASLRYSAAVGGALPALERILQLKTAGPIKAFSGILNGTTNFILDQMVQGTCFPDAVRAAQTAGYAEADATLDLDGTDAAQKLIVITQAAFEVSLQLASIKRRGIEELSSSQVRSADERGFAVRLVASCRRTVDSLEATVAPVELPHDHPLASVEGPQNRLFIEMESGEHLIISGTGAGRWPTTEAVMADLWDIRRELCNAAIEENQYLEECVA
jgi:homoserine dehydrogenase